MVWPIGPQYAEQSNVTLTPKLQGKLLLMVAAVAKPSGALFSGGLRRDWSRIIETVRRRLITLRRRCAELASGYPIFREEKTPLQ
jgi:hypothetical protein